LDLSPYPEEISLPILDGLLHWAVCPSSYAQDHLPTTSLSNLSPQRLSLETLVKLSILDRNVDLILATPPWERLNKLFKKLSKMLGRNVDQTLREFALVLMTNLAAADSTVARAVAVIGNAVPQLISFVEQSVANSQGINALRENPELMGTTLDMVRRSAACLRTLSRVQDNCAFFLQHQQRLLALVMSQILDQGVASIIADVIYECSLYEANVANVQRREGERCREEEKKVEQEEKSEEEEVVEKEQKSESKASSPPVVEAPERTNGPTTEQKTEEQEEEEKLVQKNGLEVENNGRTISVK